ncbi:MAG: TlpA family protein disulfide reductase [Gammaproteobacteria bacterium]|jgi:thiol-disulfide isomerase/thioredoxin|nr:TlpA family protein disulfide reductase [Gammaproteobacteria bacterium]
MRFEVPAFLVLMLLAFSVAAEAVPGTRVIPLSEGDELVARVYTADGDKLLVLVPNERGVTGRHAELAERLAALGVETWIADMAEARLLPPTFSSLEKLPPADVAVLIDAARDTGKQVYLLSSDRGAALVLYGVQAWRRENPGAGGPRGVLLFHPNLYQGPVPPGSEPSYLPIVDQPGPPLAILQPTLSAGNWYVEGLVKRLLASGNYLHLKHYPGGRDGFWYRDDASLEEHEFTRRQLAQDLKYTMELLGRVPTPDTHAAQPVERPVSRSPAQLRGILPHRGDPQPPRLVLPGLGGGEYDLARYRGDVVLVNFWAGWCPPCIEEMPSMQRLHQRLAGRPFRILAVNMAEDPATINAFLRTIVKVDFRILLDRDGEALKRWKVLAFPTSYLIGPGGKIRFSVFGSYEWDQPEALRAIEALMGEAAASQ